MSCYPAHQVYYGMQRLRRRFLPPFVSALIADLHADDAAVVQANGSDWLTLGPILAYFEQVAVVARDADLGFRRAESRAHFTGGSADGDTGDILDGGFFDD